MPIDLRFIKLILVFEVALLFSYNLVIIQSIFRQCEYYHLLRFIILSLALVSYAPEKERWVCRGDSHPAPTPAPYPTSSFDLGPAPPLGTAAYPPPPAATPILAAAPRSSRLGGPQA